MLDTDPAERAPASVSKHVQVIHRHVDADIICVPRKLTAHNRRRLVERKVAFIVPGNAPLTSAQMVADLGNTKMTVTRALRELQAAGLGEA